MQRHVANVTLSARRNKLIVKELVDSFIKLFVYI